MRREFIPYEQAVGLKELGFDEKTFYYYVPNGDLQSMDYIEQQRWKFTHAPLYQQAFRWFREKFGYYYTLNGKDWKFADDKQYNLLDEFYNIGSMFTISAPLYQQSFRWFREKYKLHNGIYPYYDEYEYQIKDFRLPTNTPINGGLMKYEEAELACLIKLIEIVKTK
jgi:hypothetical protein